MFRDENISILLADMCRPLSHCLRSRFNFVIIVLIDDLVSAVVIFVCQKLLLNRQPFPTD
ncbi:hypothetical protein RhiirA4_492630 [Rhizophagus irregularis]|uniref:Uncharacterized protein n=1 Tax=Rhizophagus irregularis TaxID=588596 RepID=A0A2I1HXC4_9GLOM|nr:hypothetical protein RhiirA4_492630 [Rhizophagus irregularis]